MAFAGISTGIALLVRREATMIAAANFVGLPLMFLSSILITGRQMPDWMQHAARFNPVDWGVRAARDAVVTGGNWDAVALNLALLVGLVVATSSFATWTFRAYQRSL
jgi:ABC-2 type transport system permease protein